MFTQEALIELKNEMIQPKERVFQFEENTYITDGNGDTRQHYPGVSGRAQKALQLRTLSSLVDYITSNVERFNEELFIHIEDNKLVTLKGKLLADGSREELVTVKADIPVFHFDTAYNSEPFLIALNAVFVDDHGRKDLIKFAGNVREENARETGDDGFSQQTQIKTGIASIANAKVPNPVKLAPFRTFIEIEQPASDFVFRMSQGPRFALYEADGGAWRLDAIRNIREYFEEKLEEEINDGMIVILA